MTPRPAVFRQTLRRRRDPRASPRHRRSRSAAALARFRCSGARRHPRSEARNRRTACLRRAVGLGLGAVAGAEPAGRRALELCPNRVLRLCCLKTVGQRGWSPALSADQLPRKSTARKTARRSSPSKSRRPRRLCYRTPPTWTGGPRRKPRAVAPTSHETLALTSRPLWPPRPVWRVSPTRALPEACGMASRAPHRPTRATESQLVREGCCGLSYLLRYCGEQRNLLQ